MLKSKGPPPAAEDNVTVTAAYGGKTWVTHLTVRMPKVEVQLTVTDWPWIEGGFPGYMSNHEFEIRDQLGDILPHAVELNEWPAVPPMLIHDYCPNSWPPPVTGSWMANPASGIDRLAYISLGCVPVTTIPGVPPTTKVLGFDFAHYIGSLDFGKGVCVFSREWVYYTNHARRVE